MHAAISHVLRTAQIPISRRACRTIADIRHSLPRRDFHRSAISHQAPENPSPTKRDNHKDDFDESGSKSLGAADGKDGEEKVPNEVPKEDVSVDLGGGLKPEVATSLPSQEQAPSGDSKDENLITGSNPTAESENSSPAQRKQARQGSGGRVKLNRPRTTDGLPPVKIPEWFSRRNVILAETWRSDRIVNLSVKGNPGTDENSNSEKISEGDPPSSANSEYSMDSEVFLEVLSLTRSGLSLRPPQNIPRASIPRPLLHLQCPKSDGSVYLDSIVSMLALRLNADILRLDVDDIAEIVGSHVDENLAWSWSKIAILGFETQKVAKKLQDYEKDLKALEDATADPETLDDPFTRVIASLGKMKTVRRTPPSTAFSGPSSSTLFGSRNTTSSENKSAFEMFLPGGDSSPQQTAKSASEQWYDLKVSAALDALIDAADTKRLSSVEEGTNDVKDTARAPRSILVQVKDFKFLNALPDGQMVIKKLRDAINKRWHDGRSILMLGTTSTEEFDTPASKPEIQILQSDVVEGETFTVFVPPSRKPGQDVIFASDEKTRIRRINIRHTEDMIMKLGGGNLDPALSINLEKGFDTATAFSTDLEHQVWSYARVHRLATIIMGLGNPTLNIDGATFSSACRRLEASDEVKFDWRAAELKVEEELEDMRLDSKDPTKLFDEKIRKIRSTATAHEKKLLGGVVSPNDINTAFSDVHAPKETVEALKTLTSLSLIRPEAFSYGVLATDKIPGLMLYGPPGTGKTLLAKAVAKESGATVLEISGAEVTNMYVGEGEKNVKAIFSLAKKLSPCVVFIDEADSLLGSRSGQSSRRSSYREIINQFLREWDGMKDLSAFIMVATNRPFDLDDAVLRRLPRRLLVDLPVEKDREAILKIHLKDEILDDSISLLDLAKETPFYSGSDLKNVAVSAAMACIREENEAASKHTGEEPYIYPSKRLLKNHHFTKALDEISASISEDMGTLSAIRKFDEKYGDRRGRRKKAASMGFGGTTIPERDSEAARVRKMEA